MQVSCPNCKDNLDVPDDQLATGVAKVRCDHCSFGFTIRLGDPSAAPPEEPAEPDPVDLEGVKSSGESNSAAGEIGEPQPRFISSETQTLVRVDTEFQEMARVEGADIQKFSKEEAEALEQQRKAQAALEMASKATLTDYPVPSQQPSPAIKPALSDEPTLTEIEPDSEARESDSREQAGTIEEPPAPGAQQPAVEQDPPPAPPPPAARVAPPPPTPLAAPAPAAEQPEAEPEQEQPPAPDEEPESAEEQRPQAPEPSAEAAEPLATDAPEPEPEAPPLHAHRRGPEP